jgi:quercetin dioxygenase-like cupin family protein
LREERGVLGTVVDQRLGASAGGVKNACSSVRHELRLQRRAGPVKQTPSTFGENGTFGVSRDAAGDGDPAFGRWGGEMHSDSGGGAGETAPPVIWAKRAETAAFSPAAGIRVQPVIGDAVMTCWITIDPGAVVPEHSHANEQLGVVIEGSITITAGGETRTLATGEAYAVKPDVLHRAVAGSAGVVLVETFVPVREDYRRAWQAASGQLSEA